MWENYVSFKSVSCFEVTLSSSACFPQNLLCFNVCLARSHSPLFLSAAGVLNIKDVEPKPWNKTSGPMAILVLHFLPWSILGSALDRNSLLKSCNLSCSYSFDTFFCSPLPHVADFGLSLKHALAFFLLPVLACLFSKTSPSQCVSAKSYSLPSDSYLKGK